MVIGLAGGRYDYSRVSGVGDEVGVDVRPICESGVVPAMTGGVLAEVTGDWI